MGTSLSSSTTHLRRSFDLGAGLNRVGTVAKGLWQTAHIRLIGVAMVQACAVGVTYGVLGVAPSPWQVSLIAVGATVTYLFMCQALGVAAWAALPCSLLLSFHPLTTDIAIATGNIATFSMIVFVPLAIILARRLADGSAWLSVVALGVVVGFTTALDRPGGGLLAGVVVLYIGATRIAFPR